MHIDKTEINAGIKKQLEDHVAQYFSGPIAVQVVERAVGGLEKKVQTYIKSLSYEKLYRYAKPVKEPRRKRKSKEVGEELPVAEQAV